MTSAMFCLTASAQETYENARLSNTDLNGTARYVGMGGAMEALGADISTISTNPAGIGLFRRSYANISFGIVNQDDAPSFRDASKTKMSFDQAGFVYSQRMGRKSFLNFAFNYHKSKNFNYILAATDKLHDASQNKLSYIKGAAGLFDVRRGSIDNNGNFVPNSNDAWIGTEGAENNAYGSMAYSQVDYLYYNSLIMDNDGTAYYNNADGYMFNRANSGYIGEYDFNISVNSSDRLYWGFTVGLHDVHYNGNSAYQEHLLDDKNNGIGDVTMNDSHKITGTGVDVKFGLILRPVEYSPFRIGVYVQTPTWYKLTTSNRSTIEKNPGNMIPGVSNSGGESHERYDYKFYTPWKLGVSLGHTFGDYLALGLTYEYEDYSTNDTRIIDGGYYNYYGDYVEQSSSDDDMNHNTKSALRAVSTLKAGMEFKVAPEFSVRLGYNYVSPMYSKRGYRDGSIYSPGTYYSSTTDYTNWQATNRITAGVGYTHKNWTIDLAYQYSQTNGEFHPFMDSYYDGKDADGNAYTIENYADAVKVSNKRNQLLLTVGYRF